VDADWLDALSARLVAAEAERDRYREALTDIAYGDYTRDRSASEARDLRPEEADALAGECSYFGHDGPRTHMDEGCPGSVCWAKRALTPPITDAARSEFSETPESPKLTDLVGLGPVRHDPETPEGGEGGGTG